VFKQELNNQELIKKYSKDYNYLNSRNQSFELNIKIGGLNNGGYKRN
jgi:hypothetical protein